MNMMSLNRVFSLLIIANPFIAYAAKKTNEPETKNESLQPRVDF